MRRVTGIGGIFVKARDSALLQEWYRRHLGIDVQPWGGAAFSVTGTTTWSIASGEAPFAPSGAPFMVNYRVENLLALVEALKAEGCDVLEKVEESEYGRFAWVMDPEGNKCELWQPPEST